MKTENWSCFPWNLICILVVEHLNPNSFMKGDDAAEPFFYNNLLLKHGIRLSVHAGTVHVNSFLCRIRSNLHAIIILGYDKFRRCLVSWDGNRSGGTTSTT